jgi:CubicO group peptidase (beta-lactamase class C family)
MRTLPLASAVLATLVCLNFAGAAETQFDRQKLKEVPARVQALIDAHEVAGAVTLIATPEGVTQVEAVGKSNLETAQPMKPDALFWIASMTKPITATSILILEQEGKLSIDDPVAKYIPELGALKGPDGTPAVVTLKHLLTHTSGMTPEADGATLRAATKLADLIPAYAKVPLRFEPGSKWEYCQSGINSLGRVVEVVSGQSLPEFFEQRIFKPLKMNDTTFYPTPEQAKRIATPYAKTGDTLAASTVRLLQGHDVTSHDRYPAANGGLYSTAPDYGRFCRMLLNDGTLDGAQILKPETAKKMRTIQTGDIKTGFTAGNGWGLGVCVVREPQGVSAMLSPGTFGHGGAYGTQAWIDPVKGVAYVLMVQRSNFPNSDDSDERKVFQQAAVDAMK